jgi:hypothetical protein
VSREPLLRGFDYIVITNEKTSKEKVDAMRAYGGQVIVAPSGVPPDDPEHYQNIENRLCSENPSYYGGDSHLGLPRHPPHVRPSFLSSLSVSFDGARTLLLL